MAAYPASARNIPLWMQRARQSTERSSILVLLAGILLFIPLFFPQTLPRTSNYEHYLFRVDNYATALREGRLYPRWTPNALYGYGAPIAHFSPPLPAYLPALIQVMVTGDANAALRIAAGLMLASAGLFSYHWIARRMGASAGLTGAILYLYSPYIGLTAIHLQGDIRAIFIAALLPAWLWSVDRYALRRSSSFLLMVIFFAGLVLTEPKAALVALLMSAAVLSFAPIQHFNRSLRPMIGACLLGICVAACYWLPALAESGAVRFLPTALSLPRLSLTGFLTPPTLMDGNLLNPPPVLGLGLPQLLCGIAGIVGIVYFRRWRTLPAVTAGLLLVLLFIALAFFSEFTWLLAACSLCLAATGAAVVWWTERAPRPTLTLSAVLVGIVALSTPIWLSSAFGKNNVSMPTPAAEIELERRGLGVAALPDFEPMPNPLIANVLPDQELLSGYASGSILKVSASQNPAGSSVGLIAHNSHSDQMQVFSSLPTDLHILTSYFPGWIAEFNGREIPIYADSAGLIVVTVPGGNGELTLSFGSTPARILSWIVTWFGVIATVATAYRLRNHTAENAGFSAPPSRNRLLILSVVILLIVIIGSALYLISRPETDDRLTAAERAPDSALPLNLRTQQGLELTGYAPYPLEISAGSNFDLTLYWHALRFLPESYQVSAQIVNLTTGEIATAVTPHHPGGLPTQRWTTEGYVSDSTTIAIPAEAAAGEYEIQIEIFACTQNCATRSRLDIFNADGNLLDDQIALPITIGDG